MVLHHSPEQLKQLGTEKTKLQQLHTARPTDLKSPEVPKIQNVFEKTPSPLFLFGELFL